MWPRLTYTTFRPSRLKRGSQPPPVRPEIRRSFPRRHLHDVDLVADPPVGGVRDEAPVRAPVRVAEDRVAPVPDELAHRPAREVLHEEAFGAVEVGEEREVLPVRREVGLVLGRAVGADAPGGSPRGGHLPDLVVAGALRGEEDPLAVGAPAREAVLRRVVGEAPLGASAGGDDEQVEVARDLALEDELPPRRRPAARGRGGRRRSPSAVAGRSRGEQNGERGRSGSHASSAAYSSAAVAWPSVPFALATSVALTKSSRSPSRTRSGLPVSCLVRWSLTMR